MGEFKGIFKQIEELLQFPENKNFVLMFDNYIGCNNALRIYHKNITKLLVQKYEVLPKDAIYKDEIKNVLTNKHGSEKFWFTHIVRPERILVHKGQADAVIYCGERVVNEDDLEFFNMILKPEIRKVALEEPAWDY